MGGAELRVKRFLKAGTLGRARTNLEANVDFQSELVDTLQKAGNGFESSRFNWSPGCLQRTAVEP